MGLVKTVKGAVFFACLSSLSLFATERFEIGRKDGSKLIAYCDRPEAASFSIALILPGSQKETVLRFHDSLKDDLLAIHQCALTLEKRGVIGDQIDVAEFDLALSFQERLEDHVQFFKHLKEGLVKGWNGKISIIGQGDGGRIGAALASKLNSISALVLIASGGGWPPLEETLYSFRTEMADQGFSPQYIHSFLVQAKQEFAQILKAPKPEYKAFGYTYKYWESFLKTPLIDHLALLDCPIYSINGTKDDRIPIESVEVMVKCLKDRITLNRKEGAGREIIQDRGTYREAISWLESVLTEI